MYQIHHACGIKDVDIKASDFDEAIANGQQYLCPQCGQPITEQDIDFKRPAVYSVNMHRFVQTSDPQKRGNFVCIGDEENALFGIIETNPDGTPAHDCPICSAAFNINEKTGKPKRPTNRWVGIGVEREVHYNIVTTNGIPHQEISEIVDVMETDEDGNVHPKVVYVDMGYRSFWSKLYDISHDYSISLAYFDIEIARHGEGLNTVYDVRVLNMNNPNALSMTPYEQYMPDIKGYLTGMGKPEYYAKNGYAVPGYVPAEVQQQIQQEAQPVQQPVQQQQIPMPQTTGLTSWDQISQSLQG